MTSRGWALHVTEQLEMPSGDVAWSGTLAYRDRVVATVEQSGAGGAPLIRWGLGVRPRRWPSWTPTPATVTCGSGTWPQRELMRRPRSAALTR